MLRRGHRGFTLLESLIAIVVVALGVLGVLGVQLRTLTETQTSVRRAQAMRLIEDLNERIRANPNALTDAVMSNYVVDWGDVKFQLPDCSSGCGSTDLALRDIFLWKQAVGTTLPLGDATVFRVMDTSGTNTRPQLGVMVGWRENERVSDNPDSTAAKAEDAAYRAQVGLSGIGVDKDGTTVSCLAGRICHLQYVLPTLRCVPYSSGAANSTAICP
ncbi:type IV pilus modification protein PilV [Pseudorhodoferax sp. Leaf274]|uniref:type IV pilus modification protein PilV n=1 Tax=Pseudorhodoferax sp. Leaf274 TaxID=1736318 RepID=UPI0007039405|nr:type IV pilus modification protein PilV [Pseudorhodoferax sp. Leaf274]KQP39980.1 hypothetical protein ASF44_09775 [Pseudorhodoferax sp. Leaf274]